MEVPLLVNEFLARASRLYPDKTAIVDGEKRFTYADFQARANRLSHALRALGVEPGAQVTKKALLPSLLDMLKSPPTPIDQVDWSAAPPLALSKGRWSVTR